MHGEIEIEVETLKVRTDDLEKLVQLKIRVIHEKNKELEMKNREICELRIALNDCKIMQYDGIDLYLATTDSENVEDSEDGIKSQDLYLCELCDFKTTNRNDLF